MPEPMSIAADGNVKVAFVTTLTSTTAPVVTQVTAGTDITEYVTGDGLNHSVEQAEISDDRLSSIQTLQRPGRVTDTVELTYVYQTQGSPTDNEAYEDLAEDTDGFLVIRYGDPFSDAFAAADVVDVVPVTCGVQRKMPPEANSVLRVMQRLFVTGTVVRDAVIAAS